MIAQILAKIFGTKNERDIRRMQPLVQRINELEAEISVLSDADLVAKTNIFRERIAQGATLDSLLPEAFAVVREASKRTLGMRHFDVQLIGGIVLHQGRIAEMKTGEGKTLVATLALYLNALEGKGAHLVTVNDYLAQRDAGWMGQIYDFLGLSVGVIIPDESYIYDFKYNNTEHADERFRHLEPATRQEAYAADITYGTNNEFGFDYLRDNMVREVDQLRQRDLHYAIVDEVDSILIDEARTPLIISAPATASGAAYSQFAKIVRNLKETEHYEKDEKRRSVVLTDAGVELVEKILGIKNLYATENLRTIYHLEQALKAQTLFHRDKDYVVTREGEIVIVDDFTGRLLKGRRYNEGLHQAIEAKEGVEVQEESMTLATISFQNYFRLYKKLAGMTGTAMTESEEFHQIYKLDVVEVPPNKIVVREDLPDRIFRSEDGKMRAIVNEVKDHQKRGQPVLIGTVSVEKNEKLGGMLRAAKVPHETLNAKNNEREAMIIAKAGNAGSVTLATNIAGRGTDIVLGDGVRELGGLFVLGSERHESRRIDNQLRGRGGRQGDPGQSKFYLSLQDDLMRIFGSERMDTMLRRLGLKEDEAIIHPWINKAVEKAQQKVEQRNFDMRKNILKYDNVMNDQRKVVFEDRRKMMALETLEPTISEMRAGVVDQIVSDHIPHDAYPEAWDIAGLREEVTAKLNL